VSRAGIGYDIHRLVEDRRLVLGGVTIPFEKGLLGHSDADALTHAVIDALLGAAALGNIGEHFPDTDPQYADVSSLGLLRRTVQKVRDAGYEVLNMDANVIAQEPRLSPYLDSIRRALADAMKVELESVSVKAKTNEGLGPEGSGKAISAQAVVMLRESQPTG